MRIEEARRRTERLMADHGLIEQGWTLKFTPSQNRGGCCYHHKRLITISGPITELNPWEGFIEDTALHEIAHALVGPGVGHRREWKAMALRLGARPERCYSTSMKTPTPRWKAFCHCEGKVWRRSARPARSGWQEVWCPDCYKDLTDWEVWDRA